MNLIFIESYQPIIKVIISSFNNSDDQGFIVIQQPHDIYVKQLIKDGILQSFKTSSRVQIESSNLSQSKIFVHTNILNTQETISCLSVTSNRQV